MKMCKRPTNKGTIKDFVNILCTRNFLQHGILLIRILLKQKDVKIDLMLMFPYKENMKSVCNS